MNIQAYAAQYVVTPLCLSQRDAWGESICTSLNHVVHPMSYTKEYGMSTLGSKVPKTGGFCRESSQIRELLS